MIQLDISKGWIGRKGPVDIVRRDPRWKEILCQCRGDEDNVFDIIVKGENETIRRYAKHRFFEFSRPRRHSGSGPMFPRHYFDKRGGLLKFNWVRNILDWFEKRGI